MPSSSAATLLTALLTAVLTTVLPTGPLATGPAAEPDPVGGWPLRPEPEVVAGFDAPSSPYGPGHRGVDLLGRPGQPVRAALAGQVSFAGRIAGRGVVVVAHGPTRTTYEPVAGDLAVGEAVTAGEVVGRLEVAPSHCAPRTCLHWGWIESGPAGDTYLDPLRLVGLGPVRLLPLWSTSPAPTPVDTPYRAVLDRLAALG
ncbi:M23 family metallopeptidase [Nocardioides salarius]|uniref:M23 family metallopeptidase n=1 Tax=Nocardioides salarius TaxID=374513 RepID=UPI0030F5F1E1